jgi:hypothetical protein
MCEASPQAGRVYDSSPWPTGLAWQALFAALTLLARSQIRDGDLRWELRGHNGVTPGRARLTGSAAPPP